MARRRNSTVTAAIFAVLGGCLIAAGALAGVPAQGIRWGLLRALGDGDGAAAAARADEVDQLLGGVLTGLELDKRTRFFIDQLRERLFELDLGRLYGMFPGRSKRLNEALRKRETRSLKAAGRLELTAGQPPKYHLTLFPKKSARPGRTFGGLEGVVSLKPMPKLGELPGKGYEMSGGGVLGLGELRWQQLAAMAEAWLRELERAAGANASAELVALTKSAHPALTGAAALALFAEARVAMPRTTAFLDRFVEVQQLGGLKEGAGGSYQDFRYRMRLRPDALEADYPALHEYVEDLEDLFHLETRILGPGGELFWKWSVDSEAQSVEARVLMRDGALLPFVEGGGRGKGPPFRLTTARELDFEATVRGEVRYHGLVMRLAEYPLTVRFESSDRKATFASVIDRAPTVSYSGAFLHVVPIWAMDAFIPKDIETHTREFLAAVAHGPDGKGTSLRAQIRNGAGRSSLRGNVDAAVMDNGLVTLALRIVGKRLQPRDEAIDDLRRLYGEAYSHLSADYRAHRHELVSE